MAVITSLVSYWAMDEASGNALDSNGSNTLTETSGTIDAATGKVGGARDFEDADTEYFSIASNASLQFGDVDYSGQVWIKRESIGSRMVILAKDIDTPASSRDFGLLLSSGNVPGFYFNGGEAEADWGSALTSTSAWYHLCFGHSAADNKVWIVVDNGTPVTASTGGGVPQASTSSPFRIGARAYAGFEDYFDGLIDEVALWTRDIRSDVTWLYNSGNGRSYADLVAESNPAIFLSRVTARQAVNRAATY